MIHRPVWYTAACSSAVFVLFRMNSGPCLNNMCSPRRPVASPACAAAPQRNAPARPVCMQSFIVHQQKKRPPYSIETAVSLSKTPQFQSEISRKSVRNHRFQTHLEICLALTRGYIRPVTFNCKNNRRCSMHNHHSSGVKYTFCPHNRNGKTRETPFCVAITADFY